jgi:hypothetical protein
MRLITWRRVGIIASVIWVVVGPTYFHLSKEDGDKRIARDQYERCIKQGWTTKGGVERCNKDLRQALAIAHWSSWAQLAFIPVLLAWLVAWMLFFLMRSPRRETRIGYLQKSRAEDHESLMKEFLIELANLRTDTSERAARLAKKHGLDATEMPIGALGMIFNFTTAALEHSSHYDAAWAKLSTEALTEDKIAFKRNENAQRLVMLSKTMFVWCMSSVEYAVKTGIALYPKALGKLKNDPSMRELIILSADHGLIKNADRPLWLGANTIRNRLVHNNGIGRGDGKWEFTKNLTITMEDEQMIQGTIMTFPRLTAWLVAGYDNWCDAFLEKAN